MMLFPAILAILSLTGLIVSFTAGLVKAGIDGLFIMIVCLLSFVFFGSLTLSTAARNGYLPLPSRLRRDPR